MMADPAFMQKLIMESCITTGGSLLWEAQQRGERFSKELDLVAINTLSLLAANVALVWCVSNSLVQLQEPSATRTMKSRCVVRSIARRDLVTAHLVADPAWSSN